PIDGIDPTGLLLGTGQFGFCSEPIWGAFFCHVPLLPPYAGGGGEPKPKRLYPGLNQGRLSILSTAKDGAIALLNSGDCRAKLASKTIKGRHIDGARLERELINLYAKPEGLDESVPGTEPFSGRTYTVFDGSLSQLDEIRKVRGKDVGTVYDLSYIFLFNEFFGPQTKPGSRIELDQTRALALLHETIHLFDFNDKDFSNDGKDPFGLQDFIIKSCINPNYDHNDTAF
ncbi:MAG: hypothetical protein WAV20_19565, partial [Blastocatellia bacterium]